MIGLHLPVDGETGWGEKMRQNFNILDNPPNLSAAVASSQAASAAATAAKIAAQTAQAEAQVAGASAEAAWTAALAANPDLNPVVRMNPSTITVDTTIPSFYNAYSAGPLTVGEGVEVTVNDDANWTIN
jgi:hypothetical protein